MALKLSLKALRVNAGFTQAQIAKSLNISPATLIQWEQGKTKPRADVLIELCKIYNCSVDDVRL